MQGQRSLDAHIVAMSRQLVSRATYLRYLLFICAEILVELVEEYMMVHTKSMRSADANRLETRLPRENELLEITHSCLSSCSCECTVC